MFLHARTGVKPLGGILLRRLVTGVGARRILELGTNTGFSGCCFVSAETRPTLITVEGSAPMCAIARTNLSRLSTNAVVMHRLFDDAIDELAAAENASTPCTSMASTNVRPRCTTPPV